MPQSRIVTSRVSQCMRGPIVWIARASHLLPGCFGLAFKWDGLAGQTRKDRHASCLVHVCILIVQVTVYTQVCVYLNILFVHIYTYTCNGD